MYIHARIRKYVIGGQICPPPFLTVKSLLMENTDSAFTKKYMYTYLKKYIPTKYHSKLPPTSVVKGLSKKKDVQMVGPQEVLLRRLQHSAGRPHPPR